jgi:hypothetical protein
MCFPCDIWLLIKKSFSTILKQYGTFDVLCVFNVLKKEMTYVQAF